MGFFRKATIGDWLFLGMLMAWERACDALGWVLNLVDKIKDDK